MILHSLATVDEVAGAATSATMLSSFPSSAFAWMFAGIFGAFFGTLRCCDFVPFRVGLDFFMSQQVRLIFLVLDF